MKKGFILILFVFMQGCSLQTTGKEYNVSINVLSKDIGNNKYIILAKLTNTSNKPQQYALGTIDFTNIDLSLWSEGKQLKMLQAVPIRDFIRRKITLRPKEGLKAKINLFDRFPNLKGVISINKNIVLKWSTSFIISTNNKDELHKENGLLAL